MPYLASGSLVRSRNGQTSEEFLQSLAKRPNFIGMHSRCAGPTKMARPEGFEPPTNGFGSHYSIRLSYGRTGGAF